jgi:xanthine/uracil permease
MWLAALQLCSITTVFIIYPLVLLRETGVPPATGAAIIALSFLMLGIATVVQVSVPFGPGILVPVTFTPAYLVPAIAAVKLGGLPLAFGMMVFAGVVEILLSIGFGCGRPAPGGPRASPGLRKSRHHRAVSRWRARA